METYLRIAVISPKEEISYRVQERLQPWTTNCLFIMWRYSYQPCLLIIWGIYFHLAHFTTGILVPANSSRKAHLSGPCGMMPCSLNSQAQKRLWRNCGKQQGEAAHRVEGCAVEQEQLKSLECVYHWVDQGFIWITSDNQNGKKKLGENLPCS